MNWQPPWRKPGLIGFIHGDQPLFLTGAERVQVRAQDCTEPPRHMSAEDRAALAVLNSMSEGGSEYEDRKARGPKKPKMGPSVPDCESRWRVLVGFEQLLADGATETRVGRLILEATNVERKKLTTRLCLVTRKTSTLVARLRALTLLHEWCKTRRKKWWPSSHTVFEYMEDQCMTAKGSTKAASVVSALLFAEHVLGWEEGREVNLDPRITGFMVEQISRMPLRRQAPLLLCEDMVMLEKTLFFADDLSAAEVLILGGYLLLMAFRARYSDLAPCLEVRAEGAWLSANPDSVKTSGPRLDLRPAP